MDIRKQDLQRVLNIVHDCLDIQDSDNIKSILDQLNEIVPFSAAVLCGVGQVEDTGHIFFSDIINHSYSNEWGDVYFENDFIDVDPVIQFSQKTDSAFTWSEAFKGITSQKPKIQEFLTMANDFHLQDGIAHLIEKKGYGTLLSLSINNTKNDYYSYLINHITPHLHEALAHLQIHSSETIQYNLSGRESEVLKWTSEGKSSWEIGMILSISERTVKYHVNNIKTKLNAVNRAHAVAKGLRANIIN